MLLLYIIKMTLIAGLLYCYYWFFLRNKQFHQYNRFYLLSIVMIAAILPLLHIPIPFAGFANDNTTTRLLRVGMGDWEDPVTITARKNFFRIFLNWQYLSFVVYTAGVFILFISFSRSLSYIRKISRHYPSEQVNDIHFFQTSEPGTPFSFFKRVFWNRKLNIESSEGQQIFRHELYHVRQKHSADILFMESIAMLTWFNPFIYLIKKEIKAIHEFLADEYAISDSSRYAYAELLVMQTIRNKQAHILNPFFHNQIKRRIAMITKFKNPGNNYLSRVMILPLLFILFCAFAINVNHKTLSPVAKTKTITVVIDAGHGGIDPGSKSGTGINEKDIVLLISKKIQQLSKNYNVNVVMTREKDELPGNAADIKEGLKNRTDIAVKSRADIFISIHVNSDDKDVTRSGFQMYISDNNANLLKKNIQLGSNLSETIKKDYEIDDVLIRSNKGIAVLNHSDIPAIIVECGYLTNSKDLSYISDEQNQEKIAKDILEGIVRFQKDYGYIQTDQQKLTGPQQIEDAMAESLTHNDSIPSKSKGKEKVYKKVEFEADYPGGQNGWIQYLTKNLHYPDNAVKNEIQGEVLIEFIIDKEGNISDVKAISGPEELKPESIRIVKESGKWIPAKQGHKKVNSYKKQPIIYKLES